MALETGMMKEIMDTHAPDGRDYNVRPLLSVIDEIFPRLDFPALVNGTQAQISDPKDPLVDNIFEVLSYTISKISCQMSCKCLGGGDAHKTTLSIFKMLASFSWEVKAVLALAAFSVHYGEFWMVAQIDRSSPLEKAVASLKDLPGILERSSTLKPEIEALGNLIKAITDVTKCIVEIKELPRKYITPETAELMTTMLLIPDVVYWTVRSMMACASQTVGLIGKGHEYIKSTVEASDLLTLSTKVKDNHNQLLKQLGLCRQHIAENRKLEKYNLLVGLFEKIQNDNMRTLKALIYSEDQLPLFHIETEKRASVDVLKGKIVMLFITDLDVPYEEIDMLVEMYEDVLVEQNRQKIQYEVVWLPVADLSTPWNNQKERKFKDKQEEMPWYSLYHPTMLDPAVIKFFKEKWHFDKPMVVVLDPKGIVLNPNALHMMWIWESEGFPFTTAKEEALWKEVTWDINFVMDPMEPPITDWIEKGMHVCLYGGEDRDWIRKFTASAKKVAEAAKIELGIFYVGKSNPGEKVQQNLTIIKAEKLSDFWSDPDSVWYFWLRFEKMCHSKMQLGKTTDNDEIMKEVMTMLSFDGSNQGWAAIYHSKEMSKGKGDAFLRSLTEFDEWKEQLNKEKSFVAALHDRLNLRQVPVHCNHLILPGTSGSVPEKVVCAECGRNMERFFMYRCCIDERDGEKKPSVPGRGSRDQTSKNPTEQPSKPDPKP